MTSGEHVWTYKKKARQSNVLRRAPTTRPHARVAGRANPRADPSPSASERRSERLSKQGARLLELLAGVHDAHVVRRVLGEVVLLPGARREVAHEPLQPWQGALAAGGGEVHQPHVVAAVDHRVRRRLVTGGAGGVMGRRAGECARLQLHGGVAQHGHVCVHHGRVQPQRQRAVRKPPPEQHPRVPLAWEASLGRISGDWRLRTSMRLARRSRDAPSCNRNQNNYSTRACGARPVGVAQLEPATGNGWEVEMTRCATSHPKLWLNAL